MRAYWLELRKAFLLRNDWFRVVFFKGIGWGPLVEVLFVSKRIYLAKTKEGLTHR